MDVYSGNNLETGGNASPAIFAQSVGGGGGSGGASGSTAGNGGTASIALGLGGSGAGGGAGGAVSINASGGARTINTTGAGSYGMFAQSVGGGGGAGGAFSAAATAVAGNEGEGDATGGASGTDASASAGVAIAAGLGGKGGGGGSGGSVSVWNEHIITTHGATAAGMFAQSVGGGGGNAGSATTNANSGAFVISFGLGGTGGGGGVGGEVRATNYYGAISTNGALACGMFAQSVGGGGGNAGASDATSAGGGNASVAMALGGSAGSGQNGGAVHVINIGRITTSGAGAAGILAQSVGGGGGVGGSSASSGSDGKVTMALSLGGTGGVGGAGGDVSVAMDTWPEIAVTTSGANSVGVLAQSVGGGGGAGGSSTSSAPGANGIAATLSLGGKGSSGGNGGAVDLAFYQGAIVTKGVNAAGVLAQSVGGGGGNGGSSDMLTATSSYAATLSLGGAGSGGGGGGNVNVINHASIQTDGQMASGILAQSIGGGGGNAGGAAVTTRAAAETVTLNVALGGAGGGGQNAGTVTVTNGGAVTTAKGGANAIVAQSIGGGGGNGGTALAGESSAVLSATGTMLIGGSGSGGGGGNTVTLTNGNTVTTSGHQAIGLLAQSIGGGGGVAGATTSSGMTVTTGTLSLGGTGGGGGTGGSVTITSPGDIYTGGRYSHGIVTQSIGGGGGLSAMPTTGLILGGTFSGSAADVSVTTNGTIKTRSANSVGVLAQSVGGGVGIPAGSATFGGTTISSNGGTVTVTANGKIHTEGNGAIGILAQSVGGGGGVALAMGDGLAPGYRTGRGGGGPVNVEVGGAIVTLGSYAHGVVAQSVGNGGGLLLHAAKAPEIVSGGGPSGLVTVTVKPGASITTSGQGSVAIHGSSSSDPVINVEAGASVTGGAGGAAVLLNSPINVLNNNGDLTTVDGGAGLAVHTIGGDTTINNGGRLTGSIQLASRGVNHVNNLASGTIMAGSSIELGNGTLSNAGVLAVGTPVVGTTRINGSLIQTDDGVLQVRVDQLTGLADRFRISGTARLTGGLRPVGINLGQVAAGTWQSGAILITDRGLPTGTLSLIGSLNSAILSHSLVQTNGLVSIKSMVDFAPPGLSAQGGKVAAILNAIPGKDRAPLLQAIIQQLVGISTISALDRAYDKIIENRSPKLSSTPIEVTRSLSQVLGERFDQLHGHSIAERAQRGMTGMAFSVHDGETGGDVGPVSGLAAGDAPVSSDTWSVWVRGFGVFTDNSGDSDNAGFHRTTAGGLTGADRLVTDDLRIGLNVGFARSNQFLTNNNGGSLQANSYRLGVYGSWSPGAAFTSLPLFVDVGLGGGLDRVSSRRTISLGGLSGSVFGNSVSYDADAKLGLGTKLEFAGLIFEPGVDLRYDFIKTSGYTEQGIGQLGLTVAGSSGHAVQTGIGARVSHVFTLDNGMALEPDVKLWWKREIFDANSVVSARQGETIALPTASQTGSNAALVGAGLAAVLNTKIKLYAHYDAELRKNQISQSVTARLSYIW